MKQTIAVALLLALSACAPETGSLPGDEFSTSESGVKIKNVEGFGGVLAERYDESQEWWAEEEVPKEGSPNVIIAAYGRAVAGYGPYGGLGYGAAYNPRTGTYARGAAAYGPTVPAARRWPSIPGPARWPPRGRARTTTRHGVPAPSHVAMTGSARRATPVTMSGPPVSGRREAGQVSSVSTTTTISIPAATATSTAAMTTASGSSIKTVTGPTWTDRLPSGRARRGTAPGSLASATPRESAPQRPVAPGRYLRDLGLPPVNSSAMPGHGAAGSSASSVREVGASAVADVLAAFVDADGKTVLFGGV